VRRDSNAIEEVDKLLASAGLSMDAVMAQTLAIKLDQVERIDWMTMRAEARRNTVLREVDRHRASVAQARAGQPTTSKMHNSRSEERSGSWIRGQRDQRPQTLFQSGECARQHGSPHSRR
jgi:hypothetical protein